MDERMVRVVGILIDSFFPLLKAGVMFTVPLTIISFILGMIVAFAVAVIRVSNIRFLNKIVKFYVWIIRGTPL
ncbi:MAG: cysteine transporter permease, partial [Clostridia bacterium]|nr:cysteine transporter permease [Clostridia bacterium]